jgi:hypothetical protein
MRGSASLTRNRLSRHVTKCQSVNATPCTCGKQVRYLDMPTTQRGKDGTAHACNSPGSATFRVPTSRGSSTRSNWMLPKGRGISTRSPYVKLRSSLPADRRCNRRGTRRTYPLPPYSPMYLVLHRQDHHHAVTSDNPRAGKMLSRDGLANELSVTVGYLLPSSSGSLTPTPPSSILWTSLATECLPHRPVQIVCSFLLPTLSSALSRVPTLPNVRTRC